MPKAPAPKGTVDSFRHQEEKRRNILTAEYESLLERRSQDEKKLRYPRNTDFDPQLVWRGRGRRESV